MAAPQRGEGEDWGEIPQFRTLRRLITVLTATLILGMMTIAGLLAWRILSEPPRAAAGPPALALEAVAIPAGAEIIAVGATEAALTVAVREPGGESLLVFHPETGALLKRVAIRRD